MVDFINIKCYNIFVKGGGIIKLSRISAALGIVLIAASICGCSEQPEKYTRDIYAMDTFMSLTAYGNNAQTALDEAAERINALEQSLSVTIPESDISRLNSSSGTPISVGEDAVSVILKSLEISEKTGGALDITIYPVLKAWGFTTGEHNLPTAVELASLLEFVDYTKIRIDGGEVTLPEGYSVDLGALAKGYSSDCAADILQSSGVQSAILNLGGNVCAIGSKPDGDPWKIAVASPFEGEEYLGILAIEDKFVITSGKYERYFIGEDGRKYHHIIDPETGYPSENGLAAVTVIGGSGIECDALSTALLVMGEERAREYWMDNGGCELILVTDDKRVIVTAGISEKFSCSSGYTMEILK